MGRRKIEIKAIKDDRNRSVTFLKRKGGLFKKAHELSVLCSVDVAVVIFGHNKKLYEYSSGDINDTINRFTYYQGPHEHKGPGDFSGGMDDDEDEDGGSPPMDDVVPRQNSLPPHLQQQGYIRAATSTPPPNMANGHLYPPRQHTPQPQNLSRPGSSQGMRRSSMSYQPSHLHQVTQAPSSNGYTYIRTAPMNSYPPPGNVPPGPPQNGQHLSGTQHYYNQLQHASQQAYMQDRGNQNLHPDPRAANSHHQHHHDPSPPQPDAQPHHLEPQNLLRQPKASKSRSMFTPIDDSRSLLAQHWGPAKPANETVREEDGESRHADSSVSPPKPQHSSRRHSPSPATSDHTRRESNDFIPPLRSDSTGGAKRPKLKVHIPEEQSEDEASSGSASKQRANEDKPSNANNNNNNSNNDHPAKPSNTTESNAPASSGVVLPPPSPSASALLSAGASGPPNPFARPLPPQGSAHDRNGSRAESMETPISALPSRFVADGLLPSPSSFYPEWSLGRTGGESANILPSPLNFTTPVGHGGGGFGAKEGEAAGEAEKEKKRKSPESAVGEGAAGVDNTPSQKRIKA